MAQSRPLDDSLLHELEALLQTLPDGVAGLLRPGKDPRPEMQQEGLPACADATTWWSWHDGVDERWWPLPAGTFLTLDQALTIRFIGRENATRPRLETWNDERLDDPDWMWHPRWLPIIDTGSTSIVLDMREDTVAPPVCEVDYDLLSTDDNEWPVPVAPSLGALVAACVRACREGQYTWSRLQRAWHRVDEEPPSLAELVDAMSESP